MAADTDLFSVSDEQTKKATGYTAKDIEVLEGLEPVRKRPGMYIGGTDERAYHHLMAEILDNSVDEAVAGHATRISVEMLADGSVRVMDNGRGIPVDPHPKYKDKSALEVILTTLHSGGKFSGKNYATSGGLHGVGISVVNALSESMIVEVARDKTLWTQSFSRGLTASKLTKVGSAPNRRGTSVQFKPDEEIFGNKHSFKPATLFKMARSKAYLERGVEIRWSCAEELIKDGDKTPTEAVFHFPGGLGDFLREQLGQQALIGDSLFDGKADLNGSGGKVEWALAWPDDEGTGEATLTSYCNTIPTPQGGTHENGLRTGLTRALRTYGEMAGNKKASSITADDVLGGARAVLSCFIPEPQFQGQTKERLGSPEAARLVDQTLKEHFEHWLAGNGPAAKALLDSIILRMEERLRKKAEKETARKSVTKRLRLPGKLTDCSRNSPEGTELFLVEGDSAGGSAKQARQRETQAILPLRGKILNVASASADKLRGNQELADLAQALGFDGKSSDVENLRYERVVIMTDADVDGAHIASLLMTFFYKTYPQIIEAGRLYLAVPPLYRLSHGGKSFYARDDRHKDQILEKEFRPNANVEISRFKGLGEMMPKQLRETTMDPATRQMERVTLADAAAGLAAGKSIKELVEDLMGKKAEKRFEFIQENAAYVAEEIDV
ncbi:MAG: DNA topoisomerase IV subunit B [Alphaproteobacteria bacterium]